MKKLLLLVALCYLCGCGDHDRPITHVVLFWLKDPANQVHKKMFVDKTNTFREISGVNSLYLGVEPQTNRTINAKGYDLVLTIEFSSKQALDAYIAHPTHRQVDKELRSLISDLKVYDFEKK